MQYNRVFALPALVMIVAGLASVAPAAAAKGDRRATVAGGQQVTLAKSRLSKRDLAARRPNMEQLIPKSH